MFSRGSKKVLFGALYKNSGGKLSRKRVDEENDEGGDDQVDAAALRQGVQYGPKGRARRGRGVTAQNDEHDEDEEDDEDGSWSVV